MSTGSIKLSSMKEQLLGAFPREITSLEIQNRKTEYKFTFIANIIVYIQYNDFNEYSYLILLSSKSLDRILYDNFDDRWEVPTKPNHWHTRFSDIAINSPMNGDPNPNAPILIKEIRSICPEK